MRRMQKRLSPHKFHNRRTRFETPFIAILQESAKGKSHNSRNGWHRGVLVSGALKLDHMQLIKSLLLPYFCKFSTFILGTHFLLPQRANNGKREFFQLQNWMRQRVSSVWGIQTGPFAAHSVHFILNFFIFFTFILGSHFPHPIMG